MENFHDNFAYTRVNWLSIILMRQTGDVDIASWKRAVTKTFLSSLTAHPIYLSTVSTKNLANQQPDLYEWRLPKRPPLDLPISVVVGHYPTLSMWLLTDDYLEFKKAAEQLLSYLASTQSSTWLLTNWMIPWEKVLRTLAIVVGAYLKCVKDNRKKSKHKQIHRDPIWMKYKSFK